MNAIMNETQLWYCDLCDKTINFKRKSKHINSKIQKSKQKHEFLVKEYKFT